ncbi:MAG: hypothetical protein ABIQ64_02725 [Candidatus Saccharimonadales bacterium]
MSIFNRTNWMNRTFLVTCGVMFALLVVLAFVAAVRSESGWALGASVVGATLVFTLVVNAVDVFIYHTFTSRISLRVARFFASILMLVFWLYMLYRTDLRSTDAIVSPGETFVLMSFLWAMTYFVSAFDKLINHGVYQMNDVTNHPR